MASSSHTLETDLKSQKLTEFGAGKHRSGSEAEEATTRLIPATLGMTFSCCKSVGREQDAQIVVLEQIGECAGLKLLELLPELTKGV
jgi:hypothetical protein